MATSALSGLDIALWDLKGKILPAGLPAAGRPAATTAPVYANGWYTDPGTPEQTPRGPRGRRRATAP